MAEISENVVISSPLSPMLAPIAPQTRSVEFRDYSESSDKFERVRNFYRENRKKQTVESVLQKKRDLFTLNKTVMGIWDAAELLDSMVDESDPDTDNSQIIHCLQTAEAIRQKYPGEEYDWFHLTGFIHDLGKVIAHHTLYNEPQWCVVGDTFPVGCEFTEANVHHGFFSENPDTKDARYMSKLGIYQEGTGLDNVHMSFGHDEYMYQVCIQNGSSLPTEALYIIRYHSFYPWHTYGGYKYLENETDREMLKWVKEFQRFDLYSKLPEKPNVAELTPYYKKLIAKYFPEKLRW